MKKYTSLVVSLFICIIFANFVLISPSQASPKTSFGNGTFTVGKQISPGIYRSVKVTGSCYWEISTSGSNGNDIIANDNSPGGLLTFNLQIGQDIQNNCGNFSKATLSTARGPIKKNVPNGVWIVGVDIAPGTYTATRSILGSHCYIALSTPGSNGQDIIANQNYTNGTPVATLNSGIEVDNDGCGLLK